MTDQDTLFLTYTGYYDGQSRPVRGSVPVEETLALYLNAQPLVSLMCTPTRVEELALGFLFNEGLIETLDSVAVLDVCGGNRYVDVWLEHDVEMPQHRIITSGCAGGTTFEDVASTHHQIESSQRITPQQVTELLQAFNHRTALYHRTGGVHGAALANSQELLCVVEDVGRHNTLDKIAGLCLRKGHDTDGCILLTTGRISSEMASKAARLRTPIIISRTSPTSLAVQLAEAWGITLIGYTRRRSFRVYSRAERIAPQESA